MTKFADQLFTDLMREHGPTLAHTRPPAPRRHVATRRTMLAAGAGGIAVTASAGVLVAGTGTPAYAVTTNPNGTVTLAVYQQSGMAGANAKLHQLGDDRVVVVPARPGCPDIRSLPAPATAAHGKITVQSTGSAGGSVTVKAQGIPAGDIMVVAFETAAQGKILGSAALTSAPAPSCVSIAPPPATGGPGGGTVRGHGGAGVVRGSGGSGPAVSGNGPATSSNG